MICYKVLITRKACPSRKICSVVKVRTLESMNIHKPQPLGWYKKEGGGTKSEHLLQN